MPVLIEENQTQCSFTCAAGVFRLRAAAIIIEEGHLLMAKSEAAPYYYSIGGAVTLNESLADAVCREVFEETGVRYEIDRLAFLHENFFVSDLLEAGKPFHEVEPTSS